MVDNGDAMTYAFRPQYFWKIKPTRRFRYRGFNFQLRVDPNNKLPLNKQFIIRNFGRVHYLTEHAPLKVRKQYSKLAILWNNKVTHRALENFL